MSKTKKGILNVLDEVVGISDVPINLSPQDAALYADSTDDEEHGCPGHHKLPRCPESEKICYLSKSNAKSAMRIRQRRGAGFLRVYRCEHCHHHHLTSMRFEKS